jgi:hypothetical protein
MASADNPVKAAAPKGPALDANVGKLHTDGTSLKAPKVEETKVEAKPAEAPKAEVKPEAAEKPKEQRAERFATLAREEAAIRTEREKNKAERERLENERKAMQSQLTRAESVTEFERQREIARTQPRTAEGIAARKWLLSATGLEFKDLAQDVVEGDRVDPAAVARQEADARIKAFETEQAKKAEEAQKKQAEATTAQQIATVKSQLKKTCEDGGKKFLLTNKYGRTEDAWTIMVEQYKLDKTEMSFETALQKVEDDLRRQVREDKELAEGLRELVTAEPAAEEKKSKGKQAEPSVRVQRTEAREPEARPTARNGVEPFNRKRHVDELLARHRARMNS